MHFPKFWAHAREGEFTIWRWSDNSVEEAKRAAEKAVRIIAEKYQGFFPPPTTPQSSYGYAGPFREEIVREISNNGTAPTALISRNKMGCLVLNSSEVMFVDIDFDLRAHKGGGFFSRLFGGKPKETPDSRAEAIERIGQRVQRSFNLGCRLYETKAGLRLMFTEDTFEPKGAETRELFTELKADPLYAKLCETQKSFRARLTPKPWRCGFHIAPVRWPFTSAEEESKFRVWENEYRQASEPYAVCRFVQTFGSTAVHRNVQPVLDVHDQMTKADSSLPLA